MAVNNFQRFTGKIAIVAGSSYGIGYSTARRLAKEGAKVIISSRKQENVDAACTRLLEEGLDVTGITCHVSKPEERSKLFKEAEKLGGLDIMMINAGVNPFVSEILDTPESSWDKNFEINVKASYLLTKEAVPLMKNNKSGRIIYMSTIAGFNHVDELAAYSISKLALMGLTKFAAMQAGKYNITVNCVSPGIIDTRFSKVLVSDERGYNTYLNQIPLKR